MHFSNRSIGLQWRSTLSVVLILACVLTPYAPVLKPFPRLEKQVTSAAWYNANWDWRRALTIDNTKVSGSSNFTNFPVLISLTNNSLRSTGNGGNVAQTDGGDILFTSSNGTTKLDHELETYDATTGEVVAWVQVPTLSYNSDTVLYMYYGNGTGVADQENPTGVWDDGNYVSVWHLEEDPSTSTDGDCGGGSDEFCDSTSNNHDGDSFGTMTSGDSVAAQIGNGMDFDGANDYLLAPGDFASTNTVTVSAWVSLVSPTAYDGLVGTAAINGNMIISGSAGNPLSYMWAGSADEYNGATGISVPSTMAFVVLVITSSAANMYMYTTSSTPTTWTNTKTHTAKAAGAGDIWYIGQDRSNAGRNWYGKIDEVRVENTNRSSDWLTTRYNSEYSPSTFFAIGCEQDNTETCPGVNTISGTVYTDEGVTNIGSNKTVQVHVNGTNFGSAETGASGQYSASDVEVSKGDVVTLFLNNETEQAVTVYVSSGTNLVGVDLYQNRLIVHNGTGGIVTTTHLDTADTISDTDISNIYSVSSPDLTVEYGKEFYIWPDTTFVPNGQVTAHDIDINGVLTLGSNTGTITGTWDSTGGSFSSDLLVKFTSTGSETITSSTGTFNDVEIGPVDAGSILSNGLVAHWKFDEGADNTCSGGQDACDSVGGYHATFTGTVSWQSSEKPTLSVANPYSLYVDGTDDYMTIGNMTSEFGNDASITMWLKLDANTPPENDTGLMTMGTNGFSMHYPYTNNLIYTDVFRTDRPITTSNLSFDKTQWHLLTITTAGGGNYNLYQNDNTAFYTTSAQTSVSLPTTAYLMGDASSYDYAGYMDDVRLYNRELTTAEIASIYNLTEGTAATGSFVLGSNMDVDGNLTINAPDNELQGSLYTITLSGSWLNYAGEAGFIRGSSTLSLDGGDQTLSGSTIFNNLSKTVTTAQKLTIYELNTFSISGALTLNGAASNLLTLAPSGGGATAIQYPYQDYGSAVDSSAAGAYTMGYTFVPDRNGTVTHLWSRCTSGTRNVRLYECTNAACTTGTELVNSDITTTGTSNWVSVDVADQSLTANQEYLVAVYDTTDFCRDTSFSLPFTQGNITVNESRYIASNALPTSETTTIMYGLADVTFVPDYLYTNSGSLVLDAESGTQDLQYLDVSSIDSDAGQTMDCLTGCVNSGDNSNWNFAAAAAGGGGGNYFQFFDF